MEAATSTAQDPNAKPPKILFHGKGSEYFGIFLTNVLLTIVTLGVYRPWAKVAFRKYIYQNTEFAGSRFIFTGQGSEMFIGYLKATLIFGAIFLLYNLGVQYAASQLNPGLLFLVFLFFVAANAFIIPIALHSSLRYRLARTEWRGIHFAYVGSQKRLIGIFFQGLLLSIVTLGIYTPWFYVSVFDEVAENIRLGDIRLQFEGEGSDLFTIFIRAYFLTFLTLGIYTFWYRAELFNFLVDNTKVIEKGQRKHLRGESSGGRMFDLLFFNALQVIFTLGIAYPWAHMRSLRTQLSWIRFTWVPDVDSIATSPEVNANATGDFLIDLGDFMIG
ncbi:MAG: DUF898 family protein [Bacteroidia bacterium]|nr:DUF898 family protein [Bacteroidia bacterium]